MPAVQRSQDAPKWPVRSRFQITLLGRTGRCALCLNAIRAIVESHVLRPLTQRELEVLELISQGYSNKQIANKLGLSGETVKSHVRALLKKLDTNSRAHAVAIALREGLLAT
jgi:DNA-binding NarL/FixJ family response regulator